ncbi:MAG: hypothetical protein AAF821_01920 [Cyanobacteria bacterium P01_D01_bin.156]
MQPLLSLPCQSRDEATTVEQQLAVRLADAYRYVLCQRHSEKVVQLNTLLWSMQADECI